MSGTWLTTLPAPRQAGYQVNPIDRTIRTQMDRGNARARLRTSATVDELSCFVRMTNDQFILFRAWFDDDVDGAAGGAGWFSVSLATGTNTGVVLSTQSARFIGGYQAGMIPGSNNDWDVSFKLEVRY
jgi:hypothetical protein